MVKLLRENATRADLWTVWSDFVELAALAIANAVDRQQFAPREARYMAIIGRYSKEQAVRFSQALGALTMAMECAGFGDLLGATFMELELGSKWAGQFFTPYPVCQLMAGINMAGMADKIKAQGFVTCCDPAVGAGALPIAFAEAMHLAGHNYQQCLHVTAQDVDSRAAHMAYIQLSLLHVPAVVIVGNSLAGEVRERWFTPAHVMGGWSRRLASAHEKHSSAHSIRRTGPAAEPAAQPELAGLFD